MSEPSPSGACHPLSPSALARSFSFCTGIENSAPVITGTDGTRLRIDQMAASAHDRRWREDFGLVRDLGIRYLRYGPPYYRTHIDYFMKRDISPACIMGTDYFETSESVVFPDHSTRGSNVLGYYGLMRQYHDRYRLPIMHTETNQCQALNAAHWLERQWANVLRLRQEGYPIVGFTWYSLTDQVDWDIDLREQRSHVTSNGLYDMDRRIRRVGVEYRRIIHDWTGVLGDGKPQL